MSAVELLKQATRRACEEGGESWSDDAEAEFDDPNVARFADVFAALVATDARAARIAAQTENEVLKARLAASGVAERRAVREAVLKEREACARLCEQLQAPKSCSGAERSLWDVATLECAHDIRARGAA